MHPHTAYDPVSECLPPGGGKCNHKRHIKDFPGTLDVVAVVSNPRRYRSRYDLYRAFERHILCSGARLTTVECAFGGRPFEVTEPNNPRHVQLRTYHEMFNKENLINLGIKVLPRDWEYVAWVDADLSFTRPDFVQETLHQLQHHAVVQMWSRSVDLGPNGEAFGTARSFASCYVSNEPRGKPSPYPYTSKGGYWHSGYGWAARREAIDVMGGLLDFAPLGSADFYMAWAFVGELQSHLYQDVRDGTRRQRGFSPRYIEALLEWQKRALGLRKNIGVVEGTVVHHWHGKKSKRGYNTRENILIDLAFDPSKDLKRDWQGVFQLVDHGDERSVRLRNLIREYLQNRDEDGTEMEVLA